MIYEYIVIQPLTEIPVDSEDDFMRSDGQWKTGEDD